MTIGGAQPGHVQVAARVPDEGGVLDQDGYRIRQTVVVVELEVHERVCLGYGLQTVPTLPWALGPGALDRGAIVIVSGRLDGVRFVVRYRDGGHGLVIRC